MSNTQKSHSREENVHQKQHYHDNRLPLQVVLHAASTLPKPVNRYCCEHHLHRLTSSQQTNQRTKSLIIRRSDAVIQPLAMMVEVRNTAITAGAVFGSGADIGSTGIAGKVIETFVEMHSEWLLLAFQSLAVCVNHWVGGV